MNAADHSRRIFSNPIIKDVVTILKSTDETEGEYTLVQVRLHADGGVPLHYHTTYREHFEVLEGVLSVQVGDAYHQLSKGDSCIVPDNTPHRFYNESGKEVLFTCAIQPARGFEKSLRISYELANAGKFSKKGMPKNFWYSILLFELSESYFPGLPLWFQKGMVRTLAKVARVIGAEKKLLKYDRKVI